MGLHKFMLDKFCDFVLKMDTNRMNAQEKYTGIKSYYDIPYIDDGNECHLLDVYRPEEAEGQILPVIVDIHGGAWFYGRKIINEQFCNAMTKKGFVVVNINYRTIRVEDGGQFPGIIEDVFAAYNWVYEHIAEYGGDVNNAFLIGDSAGAHLAAMSCQLNKDKEAAERLNLHTDLNFRALGYICGVSTVEPFMKMPLPILRYIFTLFFGKGWKKNVNLPLATIRKRDISSLPPVFINSAYADFMKKDVIGFEQILTDAGKEHEYVFITKEQQIEMFGSAEHKLDHVYNVHNPEWPDCDYVNEKMAQFFKAHMAE